jgi:hypothetical protein
MSPALKAVGRFWWLPVIGLLVGIVAAAALVSRQPATIYTASDTVLVSSPSLPYLRTAQMQTTQVPAKGSTVKGKKKVPATTSTTVVPPDTQVLVNAANLYPALIQSDEIRKLRVKLYGAVPGRVTASALASSTNTYGVYHPSPLPLITVPPVAAAAHHREDDLEKARSGGEARRRHGERIHDLDPPPATRVRDPEVTADHDRAAARPGAELGRLEARASALRRCARAACVLGARCAGRPRAAAARGGAGRRCAGSAQARGVR